MPGVFSERWGKLTKKAEIFPSREYADLRREAGARWSRANRNIALVFGEPHNAGMGLVILEFLQRIAIGVGAVLLLFLVIHFGMPKRSTASIRRRRTN